MNMTFALADGTCAGLRLPGGLQHEAVDVSCSEKDVSVVFYVTNEQSLGRVMSRFGTQERVHEQQSEGD